MLHIRLVGPGGDAEIVGEFTRGQRQSYAEFAVQKAATHVSKEECVESVVYFVVASDELTGEIVGGLRIHIALPGMLLPVERALPNVTRLRTLLSLYRNRGLAEMSGLWVRPRLRGSGLSGALMRTGVAAMPLLGVRYGIAFTHHHVLHFWTPLGFMVDRRVGAHAYPDERYESSLIRVDPVALSTATPAHRASIYSLREALRCGDAIVWSRESGEHVHHAPVEASQPELSTEHST